MALLFRFACLAMLALFFLTLYSVAVALPLGAKKVRTGQETIQKKIPTFLSGVWKLDDSFSGGGDLVIKDVEPEGKVNLEIFGRPFTGAWDGKKLSFDAQNERFFFSFQGWPVAEGTGEDIRRTLTGVCKVTPIGDFLDPELRQPITTGWYARLKQGVKKR